jgi:hypothetical protein
LGSPFTEEHTDAMLMIEPPPLASMPGSVALIIRYIERTLMVKLKSKSSSEHSKMLP